ncbi:8908_t:CDS:2 [Scutellospora calospora]|uniref:8908_t:CDS:1 n=1 Tax=Scutellospora calospora TaxID=85575 RepID=A0ACA9KLR6_9GLOM|nr:8908_t:CDS:2 [Scutellospora calospora]
MLNSNEKKESNYSRGCILNQYKNFTKLSINEVLDPFEYIGGREFINSNEANYLLPIDKIELRRNELTHILRRHVWKGNFSSPVEEILTNGGANVLDIGCGTGFWVLDLAYDFPNSTFVGIDILSNGFLPVNERPSNAGFIKHNLLEGIPFPDKTFDFVQMAAMWSSFTRQQYFNIIKELVRVVKHNGWIEIHEPNMKWKNIGKSVAILQDAFHTKMKEKKFDPTIFLEIPKYLESNDELTNIEHKKTTCPIGGWGGLHGEYSLESAKTFYGSLTYLADNMGISQSDYQKLLDDLEEQLDVVRERERNEMLRTASVDPISLAITREEMNRVDRNEQMNLNTIN